MASPKPVILSCDLGGSSIRAALIDAEGQTHAEVAIPLSVQPDATGHSEIDATVWWNALVECTSTLLARAPSSRYPVNGVAICGFTRTQVLLDASGELLHPAILWNDTRAEDISAAIRDQLSAAGIDGSPINAFHPLARLRWLADYEPEVVAKLTAVVEPKDYLNLRLTGCVSTDLVSMTPLSKISDSIRQSASTSLTTLRFPFPPPRSPVAPVGSVTRDVPPSLQPLVGVPVFHCSHDSWASAVGLGALRDGAAYNLTGTSEVFGVFTTTPLEAAGLLTVDWGGLYHLGGPSQNGGDVYRWFQSVLQGEQHNKQGVPGDVDSLLAQARHGQPLLFLPFLQGERVPFWNPSLRAGFIGLSRQHSATDMAFAVLEGVAYVNREVIRRAESSLNQTIPEIRLGGGGSSNPIWCQVKADVCNRTFVTGAAPEPGLLGAAATAWTGLGRFDTLQEAQEALVSIAARYEPDPSRKPTYDRLFSLFMRSCNAMEPISVELASLSTSI